MSHITRHRKEKNRINMYVSCCRQGMVIFACRPILACHCSLKVVAFWFPWSYRQTKFIERNLMLWRMVKPTICTKFARSGFDIKVTRSHPWSPWQQGTWLVLRLFRRSCSMVWRAIIHHLLSMILKESSHFLFLGFNPRTSLLQGSLPDFWVPHLGWCTCVQESLGFGTIKVLFKDGIARVPFQSERKARRHKFGESPFKVA